MIDCIVWPAGKYWKHATVADVLILLSSSKPWFARYKFQFVVNTSVYQPLPWSSVRCSQWESCRTMKKKSYQKNTFCLFYMIFTRNPAAASKCGLENILADINGRDNNFSLLCCLLQQAQHQLSVKIYRNWGFEFFATLSYHFLLWN